MTKLQHLLHTFCKPQTVKTSILTILFVAVCTPLFAQTVNPVQFDVWYQNGVTAETDNTDYALYCNGTGPGQGAGGVQVGSDRSFVYAPAPTSNQNQNDPWVSSALIEYDQPYPSPSQSNNYPNHCLGLCASYACSNLPVGQSTYSIAFPLQRITFDIFKYYNGKNPKNPDETPTVRSIDVYPAQNTANYANYTCGSYHCSNAGQDRTSGTSNTQVAECVGAHWICDGTNEATATATTCTVKYDGTYTCTDATAQCSEYETTATDVKAWLCSNSSGAWDTCVTGTSSGSCTATIPASSRQSHCWPNTMTLETARRAGKVEPFRGATCEPGVSSASEYLGCCTKAGHSDCVIFDNNGAETNQALNFCTGWDGFYEMAGEFGKSNGNFGYRATAYTNVPSDGVIADRIEIQEVGVYPGWKGATQIPIQIDVTNVHTVRSTPSLVGTITPVSAQPYTFTYRLSKDADVRIAIFDASTEDITEYGGTAVTTMITTSTVSTVSTNVNITNICAPLGGSMTGNLCTFTTGSYAASESACATAGGSWNSSTETELSAEDATSCQYWGGSWIERPNGAEVCEYTSADNSSPTRCAAWGGTWVAASLATDFGDYCYFTEITETLCNNLEGNFTWHDGACYEGGQVASCQFSAPTLSLCNSMTGSSRTTTANGITTTVATSYEWRGVCKKNTTTTQTWQIPDPNAAQTAESNQISFAEDTAAATAKIVRTLVDWQPRTGEGMKGTDKDTQISDFDSWDGRNDDGLLLPAGNYLASIQAKSQDEWPGIDFSRAVTRQVSLDPLKLTDVQVMGLNKKSTAYATISYVPTEPSTVYWEVYTPGTRFVTQDMDDDQGNAVSAVLTNSSAPTGTGPTLASEATNVTGTLVYRSAEQKSGRMNYTQRWDGTCQATKTNDDGTVVPANCVRYYAYNERKSNGSICKTTTGCQETFAYGAPMPDGNYVYVLWAEVPYNGCYHNASATKHDATTGTTTSSYYGTPGFEPNKKCEYSAENNNKYFTGVKTLRYTVGTLELERGLVGITMQPASYATLGSSPTAYGLDPYIFKYSLDRDAQVIATVENTAGVIVKHLTLQEGEPNVAAQLNTLTWDGRDDQGRMVYPGTYMFRVKAMDAMFPAQSNEAIEVFPVDMYRVVDVSTTDVYGDSNAKATISYHLSKTMNAQVNIYNKDVVIPHYNSTTGEYNDARVLATYTGKQTGIPASQLNIGVAITPNGGIGAYSGTIPQNGSVVRYRTQDEKVYRNTWTSAAEREIVGDRDLNEDLLNNGVPNNDNNEPTTGKYTVYLKQEVLDVTADTNAAWPPRVCNTTDDKKYGPNKNQSIFYVASDPEVAGGVAVAGAVNPAKVNQYNAACIYVNDKTFTNYPANAAQASSGVIDVRLQPIHTFDRSSLRIGDDGIVMEEWDALYFYNPTPDEGRHTAEEITKCTNANERANCPYEMVPDGQYPFFISARSNEPFNRYYYDKLRDCTPGATGCNLKGNYTISGEPFRKGEEFNSCNPDGVGTGDNVCVNNIDVQQEDYLYASDKVVHKINITRGPVYFLDGSVAVFPNAPQLFNASSTTLHFIPPYEINFSISRAAQVEVAIVALEPNMCSPVTDNVLSSNVNVYESRTNVAGDICKFLSTMTIRNTGHFDANAIRKIYWDGTDHTGNYVKPGIYEVRLTARNYPDAGLYEPTVKSITLNADLLKVFDLLENDNYAISQRGQNMKIGYQVSVPMKVAIQIFKPGTTIFDYSKGTLRNPTTGLEVQDIREVLVRSIVGIRPGTTLVEEVWDGLDYAGQEVPDGIYPFRFVTSLDTAAIDSVTGEILPGNDKSENPNEWKIARVADTYEYQNLHRATIAIGDGRFVCEDWKKTVFFYPNPLNDASKGTLEITKMPVPGTVSIKYFNLAGDLVRDADYTCVDANNYQTTMGSSLYFQPDNNVKDADGQYHRVDLNAFANVRNAALRCRWDRTNQHGKKVARGVYFGLVDFKAYNGREHCQKVVKILIP